MECVLLKQGVKKVRHNVPGEREKSRIASGWVHRVIRPGEFSIGSNPLATRQLAFGHVLAHTSSELSAGTRQLKDMFISIKRKADKGDIDSLNVAIDSMGVSINEVAERFQDLEDYASGAHSRTKVLKVSDIFKIASKIASALLDFDINFKIGPTNLEGSINVHPQQLEYILSCLIRNSEQAIREFANSRSRTIAIFAHPLIRSADEQLGALGMNVGRCLGISVHDTGIGMVNDVLCQVDKPYFTAWNNQKTNNQGLGLFVSRSLVEANNGAMMIKSQEGEGTLVTLCFPWA